MYYDINQIEGVLQFGPIASSIVFVKEKELYLDENEVYKFKEKPFGELYIHNGIYIIWQDYHGMLFVISTEGKLITELKGYYNSLINHTEAIYFFSSETQKIAKWTPNKGQTELGFQSNGYLLQHYYVIVKKEQLLITDTGTERFVVYSLDPDMHWFDVRLGEERKTEILRLIGMYNGVIWLVLNSGVLCGIDAATGKLVYKLSYPPEYKKQYGHDLSAGLYTLFTQMDNDNGGLFGLERSYYWEMDLSSPNNNLSFYNIEECSKEFNIQVRSGGMGYEKTWYGRDLFWRH